MITKPKHHGKKHFCKYCKDFECVLIPSTNKIDFGPNTKKYKDHTKLTLAKILLTNFKKKKVNIVHGIISRGFLTPLFYEDPLFILTTLPLSNLYNTCTPNIQRLVSI